MVVRTYAAVELDFSKTLDKFHHESKDVLKWINVSLTDKK